MIDFENDQYLTPSYYPIESEVEIEDYGYYDIIDEV